MRPCLGRCKRIASPCLASSAAGCGNRESRSPRRHEQSSSSSPTGVSPSVEAPLQVLHASLRHARGYRPPPLQGESPGGISPPGARRTVREPLDSYGSHCPAVRPETEPPVDEEVRLASRDVRQHPPSPHLVASQPLVLPPSPTNQVFVERPESRMQLGLVETPVVVDPPLHDHVEHPRKVTQGLVAAFVELPAPDFPPHRLAGLVTHRR